jgi:pimeloyl-ACP methyl ester carboxylesterase
LIASRDHQRIADITKDDLLVETDPSTPVKILIHGWIANRDHIAMEPIKHAYLSKGQKNLLVVDWSKAAALLYPDARNQVYKVGMYVGEILKNFFEAKNVTLDNVHVIGHSLGAHVAGNVGKYFKGKIGRITALDPADPLVRSNDPDTVMANDAKFVDVIHTAIGVAGQKEPKCDKMK